MEKHIPPEPSRIEDILQRSSGKPVIVLGDFMLDEFIWGRVRRISPEAPVPVVEVQRETYSLGGAGNVVANIAALGGRPVPIGLLGNDEQSDRVRSMFTEIGVKDTGGLVGDDRPTTRKTRIIAHNQQLVRTDRESRAPLSEALVMRLAGLFFERLRGVSAVVVSDYDKGVACRELLHRVLPVADRHNVPVFLDPKVHHADHYRPLTVITPNLSEAELLSGITIDSDRALEHAGRKLLDRFGCKYVLITRGEEGMSLFELEGTVHLPTSAREVYDVTGAGDTVIATLALASAAGASLAEAAWLANRAAGVVVGKVGTATVTRDELRRELLP